MGTAVYRVNPNRIGLYSTIFNLSQSGPQLLVSLGSPRILRKTGRLPIIVSLDGWCICEIIGDVSVVMVLGGLSALISASLVYILRVYILDDNQVSNNTTSVESL